MAIAADESSVFFLRIFGRWKIIEMNRRQNRLAKDPIQSH